MTGVETDRGRIQCEYFVNCAGQVELFKFFILFLLLKNMCTSLWYFFCFPFGFFNGLCFGLVYWSRSSHVTQQLSPAGV